MKLVCLQAYTYVTEFPLHSRTPYIDDIWPTSFHDANTCIQDHQKLFH